MIPDTVNTERKTAAIHLLQTGKLFEAEETFRALLAIAPDDPGLINNLGLSLLYQGKIQQAISLYEESLHSFPNVPEMHYNLGLACHRTGELIKARSCYEQTTLQRPTYFDAFRNLSAVCLELDQKEPAMEAIKRAHELRPDDATIHFQLLAMDKSDKSTPPCPPKEYVAQLFDDYASHFDRHLTGTLAYAIPQHLRSALELFVEPGNKPFLKAIDLGCGTGLAGEAIKDLCVRLIGVDLSAAMLAKAHAKKIYNTLQKIDLHDALATGQDPYDLVVATDVLIYVGELEQVFRKVRQRLTPGGYFCFSLETDHETPSFRLQRTARMLTPPLHARTGMPPSLSLPVEPTSNHPQARGC